MAVTCCAEIMRASTCSGVAMMSRASRISVGKVGKGALGRTGEGVWEAREVTGDRE